MLLNILEYLRGKLHMIKESICKTQLNNNNKNTELMCAKCFAVFFKLLLLNTLFKKRAHFVGIKISISVTYFNLLKCVKYENETILNYSNCKFMTFWTELGVFKKGCSLAVPLSFKIALQPLNATWNFSLYKYCYSYTNECKFYTRST